MGRRVVVTGAGGQLGRQLLRAFANAGDEVLPLARPAFDLEHPDPDAVTSLHPDIVVNAAAWTDVDGCARDPQRAMRLNGEAPGVVAAAAASVGALVIQVSTNEVFDGTADRPYAEGDEPNPVNPYGASKLAGERAVRGAGARHVIVRTAWLFGPGGTNFVTKILAAARRARAASEPLRVVDDEWGNPTWTPDLAAAIVEVAGMPTPPPTVHAAGSPPTTRFAWAGVAVTAAGVPVDLEPIPGATFPRASRVPPRAVLAATAGMPFLDWRSATIAYATDLRAADPAAATSGR